MLGFSKKKRSKLDANLYAAVEGEVIELEKVDDPVFSQKMLGEGFAIEPTNSMIVSPVTGSIIMKQGHALGIKRADGLEVLVHVGIDTVNLEGRPFNIKVNEGDIVQGGEELASVDWSQIEKAGLGKTTMVIFTNSADKLDSMNVWYSTVKAGEIIGEAIAK